MVKIVPKTWGHEKWLVNNDKYCGKILVVNKYKFCSYHYHKIKDETFYLLKGRVDLVYGNTDAYDESCIVTRMNVGDSFHIPVGMRHRFIALEDSEIIEISTHHEDSDSIRVLPPCE
jgi:mannose-6-phosphate isomerase-like protein (cupin superfamily)